MLLTKINFLIHFKKILKLNFIFLKVKQHLKGCETNVYFLLGNAKHFYVLFSGILYTFKIVKKKILPFSQFPKLTKINLIYLLITMFSILNCPF